MSSAAAHARPRPFCGTQYWLPGPLILQFARGKESEKQVSTRVTLPVPRPSPQVSAEAALGHPRPSPRRASRRGYRDHACHGGPRGGLTQQAPGGQLGTGAASTPLFWLLVPYAGQRLLGGRGGSGSPPWEGRTFPPRKVSCRPGKDGGVPPAAPALGTEVPAKADKFAGHFWEQRKKPLGWRWRQQSQSLRRCRPRPGERTLNHMPSLFFLLLFLLLLVPGPALTRLNRGTPARRVPRRRLPAGREVKLPVEQRPCPGEGYRGTPEGPGPLPPRPARKASLRRAVGPTSRFSLRSLSETGGRGVGGARRGLFGAGLLTKAGAKNQ